MQLVAKSMLTSYRDHFGELDTLGTVRFLADQVVETVLEKTSARGLVDRLAAAAPGRDDDVNLLDRDWQRELFAWRESHVVAGLARRLRRAAKGDGADVFEAVNRVQAHSLRAAHAHVHRLVLDAFAAAIEGCDDDGARALLGRACDLYVLAEVESDRGWFLEHGRLTPAGVQGGRPGGRRPVPRAPAARAHPGGRARHPARMAGRRSDEGSQRSSVLSVGSLSPGARRRSTSARPRRSRSCASPGGARSPGSARSACRSGEESQHPTWPQVRQSRRCTQRVPSRRHSSQPSGVVGITDIGAFLGGRSPRPGRSARPARARPRCPCPRAGRAATPRRRAG